MADPNTIYKMTVLTMLDKVDLIICRDSVFIFKFHAIFGKVVSHVRFNGGRDFIFKKTEITEEMKLAAAKAIAGLVSDTELNEDFIMPEAFDPRVAEF